HTRFDCDWSSDVCSSDLALAPHPRNVPDDVLALVAKNGGVVMVNFYSGFITPDGARSVKEMFRVARQLKEQYPNEKEFETALEQIGRASCRERVEGVVVG